MKTRFDFDPLDDGDLRDVERSNRERRDRLAREKEQRAAAEEPLKVPAVTFAEAARKAGFENVTISIHPGRCSYPTEEQRRPKIDVTPSVVAITAWRGFPMACQPTREGLRRAGLRVVERYGSFDHVLEGCAPQTVRSWKMTASRFAASPPEEIDQWMAHMARAIYAICSEAEYRFNRS